MAESTEEDTSIDKGLEYRYEAPQYDFSQNIFLLNKLIAELGSKARNDPKLREDYYLLIDILEDFLAGDWDDNKSTKGDEYKEKLISFRKLDPDNEEARLILSHLKLRELIKLQKKSGYHGKRRITGKVG